MYQLVGFSIFVRLQNYKYIETHVFILKAPPPTIDCYFLLLTNALSNMYIRH